MFKLRVVEDAAVDGIVTQEDIIVSSGINHGENERDEQNVANHIIEHEVERSFAQEHLLSADDERPAWWLVVRVFAHVVNHQPT